MNEHYDTPEGLAQAYRLTLRNEKSVELRRKIEAGEYILQPEDYALDIPFNDEEEDIRINW